MEAAFKEVDAEGKGAVDVEGLQKIGKIMARNEEEMQKTDNLFLINMAMSMGDTNGDKKLSLEELLKLSQLDQVKLPEEEEKKEEDVSEEDREKERLVGFVKLANKENRDYITAEELKQVMQMMDKDVDDETVKLVFSFADTNGDKKLQLEEVILFLLEGEKKMDDPKERAKMMFRMLDTNGDGYIDKKELKEFFKEDADEGEDGGFEARMMVAMFDEDDDGKLNLEEFSKMIDNF